MGLILQGDDENTPYVSQLIPAKHPTTVMPHIEGLTTPPPPPPEKNLSISSVGGTASLKASDFPG